MYLSITQLEAVISATKSKSSIVKVVVFLFEPLFKRLISATPITITMDPIIWRILTVSPNIVIAKIKVKTVESMFVAVTRVISVFFKTLIRMYQQSEIINPFTTKIHKNSIGIPTPKGIKHRLNKKATLENKTSITAVLIVRFVANFFDTLKKPFKKA